ncbi:MAG: cysteine synthase A [Spirochaetes bacterium]|nr:cysteine synthase A [Spirochaetota bacterium]
MVFAESILGIIGKTPLIKLRKISEETGNTVLAKAEFMNPASSVKDRAALFMISSAEKQGKLKPNSLIVEPTSGNTGIGLALVCAVKGYKLILVMPESMSIERRNLLAAMSAEVVLTPSAEGMSGAIKKAQEIADSGKDYFMPMQFSNAANALAHYETTGPEIWEDSAGKIDWFVAGVGTGGTVSGCGKYLKERNSAVKIAAAEPLESSVITGEAPGAHAIQGIGAGFIPEILDISVIDKVIRVKSEDAIEMSRSLLQTEGIFSGISSGANVFAAKVISEAEKNKGLVIVTILCDSGERYLSTGIFTNPLVYSIENKPALH